ncbi:hypothetical protein ACFE04_001621 [Oxalis oulophora]
MTKLPFLFAVIFPLFLTTTIHALGSGSTLAAIYGSPPTVCGIVASQSTQYIVCQQNDRNFTISIDPNVSFSAVAGGASFFCGIRSGGHALLCWDTSNSSFAPKRLYYNTTVTLQNITIGDSHICATTSDASIKCWRGINNAFPSPVNDTRLGWVTSGYGFSCGIDQDTNKVACWGTNQQTASLIESEFANISLLSLFAGGSHACGLNASGFLICKGDNSSGQLNVPYNSVPYTYSGALALGTNHSCAIRRSNGSVICWGGTGDEFSSSLVANLQFEFIVAGSNFTCGLLKSNFSVVCWGPGWLNSSISGISLALPDILPGPCVQSSCSECGIYPDSQSLCSGSGNICKLCEFLPNATEPAPAPSQPPPSSNSDKELAAATNDFSLDNKIGSGSFGVVYRAKLSDGREVAIKRGETASKTKKFQEKESAFDSELSFLSRLHHKHLVRLVGYCEEKEERLLVYDYMKNGSLYNHLHGKDNLDKRSNMIINSWKMRIKIALDAARGIEYLHIYAVPPIIHRDIKSSNILLDSNWTARVSDFGLSMLRPGSGKNNMPMKAAGTVGYIDPEYYGLNVLTAKTDVYGLGVVLLELLTGKRAIFKSGEDGATPVSIVDFAVPVIMAGELGKILDPRVGPPEINEGEAVELVAYTAMHCVHLEGKDRPTISDIVANLERALALCQYSRGSISSDTISIVAE